MQSRQFPIGTFTAPDQPDAALIASWIDDIERLPSELRSLLKNADAELLDTPYRDGGWTVRQVVHHLADSHMNSLIRFKLALTEEEPTIKPYREELWAELGDTREAPIELSLSLLEGLHARWVLLLRSLSGEQLSRTFRHPDSGVVPLFANIGIYAWHGRHHLAHIRLVTG
ncbi:MULTISPECIES: YfiT family bacillithiol transferase [Paenibacillus]|uniref:YfiT family bacillithiol transferase n=1 Tax=Paenibacillus TaxID=44249 RepID=UPI00387381E7